MSRLNRFEWLKAVLQCADLNSSTKAVASALSVQFANDRTGQLNPSLKTLDEFLAGMSLATIKRCLKQLVEFGWLFRTEGRGAGNHTEYDLRSPAKIIPFRWKKKDAPVSLPDGRKGSPVTDKGRMGDLSYIKKEQSIEQNPALEPDLPDGGPSGSARVGCAQPVFVSRQSFGCRQAQQVEVMDAFEALAFAGMDSEQFDLLWVRHSHEDRVELHFCTPRLELTTGKSLNIAPPGYQTAYDSLRDLMNKAHAWADPMDLHHAQEVQTTVEAPTRAQGREELHEWILDQISVGTITDRASMVDALADAGFDIPRVSKSYITAKDPDTGERWRLRGEIFHDDWQADPAEREIERGYGQDPKRARRLDGFSIAELQERYSSMCNTRAEYNRSRYAHVLGLEREDLAEAHRQDQILDSDLTLGGDNGLYGVDRSNPRTDFSVELETLNDSHLDAAREVGHPGGTSRGSDLSDPTFRDIQHSHLHSGESFDFLCESGAEVDGSTSDSFGKRLTRLRRTIGEGLRELHKGVAQFGRALDERDRGQAKWLSAVHRTADEITSQVRSYIGRLADRRTELHDAGRELADQFKTSESRRNSAERKLNERLLERDRDYGFHL